MTVTAQQQTMNLGISEKAAPLLKKIQQIITNDILPVESEYFAEVGKTGNRWQHTNRQIEILETLKATARQQQLWNLWLTDNEQGAGLSTVDYAYLAEAMGWSRLAAEVFNCSAPDTGNMEVLLRFGSKDQQQQWLPDLLKGKIRSAFCMSEPQVASSDATNIAMPAVLEDDEWVLNGDKHWISGAGDERCKVYIVMVKTDPDADRHAQHSMILVPADTPGIEVIRPMLVFGHDDAPHGHMQLRFTDVRVPENHLIWQRGKGFAIAQGRLGPGRIHHCMRALGQAEHALQLMVERARSQTAFGRPLAKLGGNSDVIADCRMQIEMTRLLCLKAAWMMDEGDLKAAAPWISMIKVQAPQTALKIVDEAIQMYGGLGLTQDTPLAEMYTWIRTLRFADGPDAVHKMVVAKHE